MYKNMYKACTKVSMDRSSIVLPEGHLNLLDPDSASSVHNVQIETGTETWPRLQPSCFTQDSCVRSHHAGL